MHWGDGGVRGGRWSYLIAAVGLILFPQGVQSAIIEASRKQRQRQAGRQEREDKPET